MLMGIVCLVWTAVFLRFVGRAVTTLFALGARSTITALFMTWSISTLLFTLGFIGTTNLLAR
jgi:hypothetical protein